MSAVRLHYEASGPADAPAVLLGGSLGTNLAMWAPQISDLSRDHRVIAFDQRGHGHSPTPKGPYTIADLGGDVVALLDQLGLERASYCGLSVGGMAGIWLGGHASTRLSRLVLMCTAAVMPPGSNMSQRAAAVREAGTTAGLAGPVVEKWFTPAWQRAHHQELASFKSMMGATDAEGYASCCEAIAAMDLRAELAEITAPTLIVSAAQDLAIPAERQRALAAAIPGARLVMVNEAAHLASVEQPETVNALIREHVDA